MKTTTNYAPRMYVPIHWGYASEQDRFENEGYFDYNERTEDVEWEEVEDEEGEDAE